MKLETGMYVKYKNFANISKIAKIIKIEISDNNCYENYYHFDNEDGTLEGFIIKASHNPIDLIEVGDYVNEYKVTDVYPNLIKVDSAKIWEIHSNEIESIVTKEQFDLMKYDIGG